MSKLTLDFPKDFDGEEYLLDSNFNFYQLSSDLPGVFVFVELYVASKEAVKQLPYGTPSLNHSDAFFFEARNYNNIGGGYITFERHFVKTTDTIATEDRQSFFVCYDRANEGGKSVSRTIYESAFAFSSGGVNLDLSRQFDFPGQAVFNEVLVGGVASTQGFIRRTKTDFEVNYINREALEVAKGETFRQQGIPLYRKRIDHDGATPWEDLNSEQRRQSIAERLQTIHAESKDLVIDPEFAVLLVGPVRITPPLVRIETREIGKEYKLTLGTRTEEIGGIEYDLWDSELEAEEV